MILCVDPDATDRDATRTALEDAGFDTVGRDSLAGGKAALDDDVECVVTEQTLPDGTGLELVQHAREVTPDAACVLFTDVPLADIPTEEFGETVAEYLDKSAPDAHAELVALVEHSLSFVSQTAYPLPEDEDARLAALDRYAADPEALRDSLDRLTELATELFDVNSAAVGLIDAHHERFLSCHGTSFDTIDREASICTYAILDPEVTVIEDVPADPRFESNEGLRRDGIEFYAGAPLLTPEGHAIGVFCIHDDEPRQFGERDRRSLGLLADEAMEQLALRRRLDDATGGAGP